MTLRFVDSFDHYATADLNKKWGASSGAVIGAYGRNGTQGVRCTGNGGRVEKTFDAQASWAIGFAVSPVTTAVRDLLTLYDTAVNHITVKLNIDNTISILRGNTTLILGPSASALPAASHSFVEVKCTILDAAGVGTLQVRVNGVVVLSNTGAVDTRNAGNASANRIFFGDVSNSSCNADFEDVYICDGVDATATQGAPFNDFLGDCRVKALATSADGNYTGSWTRNGAGVDADYKAVDETLQDGDTTYLSDNTVDHRSSWTFGSMGSVGTVKAVAMNCVARKDDAGTKLLDVFARRTATDYDRNKDYSLLDAYSNHQDIWGVHPDGTAWTPTIVNALEAGIRMDT